MNTVDELKLIMFKHRKNIEDLISLKAVTGFKDNELDNLLTAMDSINIKDLDTIIKCVQVGVITTNDLKELIKQYKQLYE